MDLVCLYANIINHYVQKACIENPEGIKPAGRFE
jgi:hypothetical protein